MSRREFRLPALALWLGSSFLITAVLAVASLSFESLGGQSLSANAAGTDGDWSYVDHDFAGTRYSVLAQITPQNVDQLSKVCSYTFPEKVPSETAPIVSSAVLYATSTHFTIAMDAADCRVLWSYRWEPRDRDAPRAHRGVAIADGKIIRGTADGYLIALDAASGQLLWAKQIANPNEGYFISMPPLVYGDLIYIGPAGSESAANGWIGAFRLTDGEQVWKFNIIPADGELGADTWGLDPDARKHGGGALWTPLSYDVEKDLLYVPGGNPAPDFYDEARPGANLFTNSMIALDAKSGRLAWYKQFLPHDVHDYDTTHVNPVFKIKSHTAIASTGKDGILRVIDRDSQSILYSVPFVTRINADAPITTTPLHVCPGTLGGSEWNSAAYNPKLNLLVVPSNDQWCSNILKYTEPPSAEKANLGLGPYFGGPIDEEPFPNGHGRVTAFDAATGRERWRYESPTPMVAGVALTGSNMIFTGETGGYFDALDARSGKILLRQNLRDTIQGGIITYAVHNVQHVAVVSGDGGVISTRRMPEVVGGNPTITVFALQKTVSQRISAKRD